MRSGFLSLVLCATALVLLACVRAEACSCSVPGPPCQAYGSASAVFLGTVESISHDRETGAATAGTLPAVWGPKVVRFAEVESFLGVTGESVSVWTGSGGGDCGYNFVRGSRYLVYAYRAKDGERLYTGICSRTRPATDASEDLEYLRRLSERAPGATISGAARPYTSEPAHRSDARKVPLAGLPVVVEGDAGRYETRTDERGSYQLTGLPAGSYKINISLPDEFATSNHVSEVTISDKGCANVDFIIHYNGRVSGRLLDASGRPASHVTLVLISTGQRESAREVKSYAVTDDEGRYEFRLVVPGEYLLGVNQEGASSAGGARDYPPTFYPGVLSAEAAERISVGAGQQVQVREFRLSPPRRAESRPPTF